MSNSKNHPPPAGSEPARSDDSASSPTMSKGERSAGDAGSKLVRSNDSGNAPAMSKGGRSASDAEPLRADDDGNALRSSEGERSASPLLGARMMIVAAAVLWSTGGAAIKLSSATAPQLAVGRAVVCAVVLFLFFPRSRMRWTRPILLTAAFYACTCSLFVFANTLTTAGNTIFIQNTAPIWVLLLGPWLLKERATFWEKVSVPVSLLGCLLFFLDDVSPGRLTGNICALIASVTYAVLIICYRKIGENEGLAATVAGNVLIAIVLGAFALDGPTPTASDFAVFIYLGAIQQAFAAILFIRGIRGVSALEGALLILFEPLLSPVWAFLLAGEELGVLALSGAALVLGATVLRVRASIGTSGPKRT